MPVSETTVPPGEPTVQATGEHRGTVTYIFDDARTLAKALKAPDRTAWDDQITAIVPDVEAEMAARDAQGAVDSAAEVDASGEATREETAVAYLRAAWTKELPHDAFLLFDKFNNYRIDKGWSVNQVAQGLASAGLTAEEWAEMKQAYLYLADAGRPEIMADYAAILDQWRGR